ncbi:MAG: hypothetical protein H6739_10730 [Alphaproteobacteria bacterium]|nr:hypothetical protein [Alphaproteobacteria bacterium]
MRVALFVTGDMESEGLAMALGRLFRGHTFQPIPYRPDKAPFDGFTGSRLPVAGASAGVRSQVDELVRRAAGVVKGRRGEGPPDLLLLLDDLELANADQPDVAVAEFRDGVQRFLGELGPGNRERTAAALRQRVSLHFAAPMIESWLFADPGGLVRAGVPATQALPVLPCASRYEEFLTQDPTYLGDDCAACEGWAGLMQKTRITRSKRRAHQPLWCGNDRGDNPRHPKRYLAWLCRDRAAKRCSRYQEVSGREGEPSGATALAGLQWGDLLANTHEMPFLNAMIEDLAHGLGEASPLPESAPLAPQTRRKDRAPAVLRNL